MDTLLKSLFRLFQSRDSKTIEIYLDLLNMWWLFILWYPGVNLGIENAPPLFRYLLFTCVGLLTIFSIASFILKRIRLRIAILSCYSFFYFLTGLNLLSQTPPSVLGGFFICQGILATLLTWKIQSRE